MFKRLLYCLNPGAHAATVTSDAPPATPSLADRLIAEGNQGEDSGDLVLACQKYREAVAAAPGYARAHLNLGIGLEAAGDVQGARDAYETARAIDPDNAYVNYNLGKLLLTRQDLAGAEPLLRKSLATRHDFPEAHVVLANILSSRGALEEAAKHLEEALRLQPDFVGALVNYTSLLAQLGRARELESTLRRIVALDPNDLQSAVQLGGLLHERGEFQDALMILNRAAEIHPQSIEVHSMLFNLHNAAGHLAPAIAAAESVLAIRPDWVDAQYDYGLALKQAMRLEEAEAALQRALSLAPGHARASRVLGGVLLGQARVAEAIGAFQAGRGSPEERLDLDSAELFALNCSSAISTEDLFARHVEFGARLEAAFPARFDHPNIPNPERRLRIGYVSGEMHFHVVSQFLLPLLEKHDRRQMEIFCYSTGNQDDEYSGKIRAQSDHWQWLHNVAPRAIADRIHQDGIDILVDLAGHSGLPNLPVFAQQPSPVQATWLGYLHSTGLTRIQYRITDLRSDPAGIADALHTEKLLRLPANQWCYRPLQDSDFQPALPALRNGFITFGSFNHAIKLSTAVRGQWAQLLLRLPKARLVVLGIGNKRAGTDFLHDMETAGVARDRIRVQPYLPLPDYYRQVGEVDIALDTSPYSGGTTTCDALWMGVPVITAPGTRSSSRSAASLLGALGLQDWIAESPEDYVERAVSFARQPDTLAALRQSLRDRMKHSSLMDAEGFARRIEAAYREMWKTYCKQRGH